MKLLTEISGNDDDAILVCNGDIDVSGDDQLEHDAACAHALMQELAVLRDASESMESTHGRLVLKLLDLLDDRAERLMAGWGFDSGEAE